KLCHLYLNGCAENRFPAPGRAKEYLETGLVAIHLAAYGELTHLPSNVMLFDGGGDVYSRILQLGEIAKKKSTFLLGPRQTGKSTLFRTQLQEAPSYSLLDAALFRSLSADQAMLRREILALKPRPHVVVIDEIQRLPDLLNEVHLMIEE